MYPTPNWEIPEDVQKRIQDSFADPYTYGLYEESPWLLRDILTLEGITTEVLTDSANSGFLSGMLAFLADTALEGCERYLETWLSEWYNRGRDCLLEYMVHTLEIELMDMLSESL